MKVSQAIRQRYSCRSYSSKKVPRKIILGLLELANQAPSAINQQNRNFIIVTDKKSRDFLAEMNNQEHLVQAPTVILVCSRLCQETVTDYLGYLEKWEMTVNGIRPGELKATSEFEDEVREMRYRWMVSDAAAAVENLLLAATDKGLATCWVGVMDFQGVTKRFGLPKGMVPICLVTLGYAKESPSYRSSRKPIKKLVSWGKYQSES